MTDLREADITGPILRPMRLLVCDVVRVHPLLGLNRKYRWFDFTKDE